MCFYRIGTFVKEMEKSINMLEAYKNVVVNFVVSEVYSISILVMGFTLTTLSHPRGFDSPAVAFSGVSSKNSSSNMRKINITNVVYRTGQPHF